MRHRLLLGAAVVATALACSLIVGLSIHIVDGRNNRAEATAAKLQAVAVSNLAICRAQATDAGYVNAVVSYVQSFASQVTDPDARAFINGFPVASPPKCDKLVKLAGEVTTTTRR